MKWEPEAEERLKRVPFFVRPMAKSAVERLARERGLDIVTPDLMEEVKNRSMGGARPSDTGKTSTPKDVKN